MSTCTLAIRGEDVTTSTIDDNWQCLVVYWCCRYLDIAVAAICRCCLLLVCSVGSSDANRCQKTTGTTRKVSGKIQRARGQFPIMLFIVILLLCT